PRAAPRLVSPPNTNPPPPPPPGGPAPDGGHLYSRQVAEAARLAAAATGCTDYDVVWQSRSGPPQVPWLDPDIVDHLDDLGAKNVEAVIVCPVGFVSDHLEVIWDLDNEAREKAAELGMAFVRAGTPGTDPRFARMVVELIGEQLADVPPRRLGEVPGYGCTPNGESCFLGCCALPSRGTVHR
uniref:ferrochelatase n=1 Tax=Nocardia brasiliensis TaxID=37326 RepID=UPI00245808E1